MPSGIDPSTAQPELPVPTSVPYCQPVIANIARQIRPASVLDVGVGFGKYGFLFREFTDIWDATDLVTLQKEHWRTRIDGIEATRAYLTPVHDFIYDRVYVGNATEVIDRLGCYDIIMMGDCLEHFEKSDGEALVTKLYERANHSVILTFPELCSERRHVRGNPYEDHASRWSKKDFRSFAQVGYRLFEARAALCVLTKPPNIPPLLTACFAARRRTGWKGVAANVLVRTFGSLNASKVVSLMSRRTITLRL